jgi:hypothetical protein
MSEPEKSRRRPFEDASVQDWLGSNQDPDVLLCVPDLGVDKITLTVEDLVADVDLHARVLNAVDIHVGAHVTLGKVSLEIENVHAQAMLKVKLDKVSVIVDRIMQTIDNHPEILTGLLSPIGEGVRQAGIGVREGLAGPARAETTEPPLIETARDVHYDRRADPEHVEQQVVASAGPGIETVYLDGQWWNREQGTSTRTGPHGSKDAAVNEGRDLAKEAGVQHVVFTLDGAESERHTYGGSP